MNKIHSGYWMELGTIPGKGSIRTSIMSMGARLWVGYSKIFFLRENIIKLYNTISDIILNFLDLENCSRSVPSNWFNFSFYYFDNILYKPILFRIVLLKEILLLAIQSLESGTKRKKKANRENMCTSDPPRLRSCRRKSPIYCKRIENIWSDTALAARQFIISLQRHHLNNLRFVQYRFSVYCSVLMLTPINIWRKDIFPPLCVNI